MVVPATNAPPTLRACLDAIAAADGPDEIVVVDDSRVRSPAAARNLGVARSSGDVIVFVDADVAVAPDVFERIAAAFDDDPSLTALFGSYEDAPPARGPVSGFRNLLHHHVHQRAGGTTGTFWAGLGAIRRGAFERAGGFVEHPVEDIELGMRLAASGASIRLEPAIQGAHLKAWNLFSMIRTDLLVRGAPWVGLLLEHRSPSAALNLGWRHRLSALASLAILVGAALLSAAVVVAAVAALVALNFSFYRLIVRRRGVLQAAAGVLLHVVHHLVAVVALVLGIVLYVAARSAAREEVPDAIPADVPAG